MITSRSPSAMLNIFRPVCALFLQTSEELNCPLIFSDKAKPAASSPALLIFIPVDNLCIEVARLDVALDRFLCTIKDVVFVFTTILMRKISFFSFCTSVFAR